MIQLPAGRELVVDNFAGGGGASLGIEQALGHVDVAINHDPKAIAIHKANHPLTRHYEQSITSIDPVVATEGKPVGLGWFSPDCKHFSKAKGGKPVEKNIRDLAWVVVHWAQRVRPRVIILENVEEFATWGPINPETHRPCKAQRGLTFRRWVKELKKCGYRVEWRELRAHHYGVPTTRKRLYLIARCDGLPIVWPRPTHGPGLLPYRTAAECIDWSLPSRSIFGRKRPLAEATLRRIARGVIKYVLEAEHPFFIPLTHQGDTRVYDLKEPFKTITAAQRGEWALVVPNFIARYGERKGQARTPSTNRPLPTIVPTGNGAQLVASHLMVHRRNADGQSVQEPIRTITAGGVHFHEIRSFLVKYYGNSVGQSAGRPLDTVTSRDRFGLVTVAGINYQIADIQMRMLSPRELYRGQGFPDTYIIDPQYKGKPLTKTAQLKACGNSVCPGVARALVKANVSLRGVVEEAQPVFTGGLFG